MRLVKCPTSNLLLPSKFVDEKEALKKCIGTWVDKTVLDHQYLKDNYFLTFHAKFRRDLDSFAMDAPKITWKLPPFLSNTIVFWVSNVKGICEVLWTIPPKKRGGKLSIEFNKKGVAYLQTKGAMPS